MSDIPTEGIYQYHAQKLERKLDNSIEGMLGNDGRIPYDGRLGFDMAVSTVLAIALRDDNCLGIQLYRDGHPWGGVTRIRRDK